MRKSLSTSRVAGMVAVYLELKRRGLNTLHHMRKIVALSEIYSGRT